MDGETTIGDAQIAVADAAINAAENARAETDSVIAAVVAEAERNIDAANETAERVIEGAMQTEIVRQFGAFKDEVRTWLDQNNQAEQISTLTETVAELKGQISAMAMLQVSPPDSLSLTPPQSQVAEAVETVAEILPESLSKSAVAASPEAPTKQKVRRWI